MYIHQNFTRGSIASGLSYMMVISGGVIVKPSVFGREDAKGTVIHELGHALGLWHVHHGLSEMECDDPCIEKEPSLLLGDLCMDTNPTTVHDQCGNPVGSTECGFRSKPPTPYKNYMSYAGGSYALALISKISSSFVTIAYYPV